MLDNENISLNTYPSEEALKAAVLSGDEPVGIALPDDLVQKLLAHEKPKIVLYLKSDLPDDYRAAYNLLMEELGFMLAGQGLKVDAEEIILGTDMVGMQIAPRFRMLPVLAVIVLMFEALGLASLITSEVEAGTLRALLVTKLRLEGLFLSKSVTGVFMAFTQAVILLVITGGLKQEPGLLLFAMFLGSLLVTGVSFLIASLARDLMTVIAWGMLVLIILAIPAFNVLLPGLASGWIKMIPSYYLVDTVHQVINFGAGWSQMYMNLLALTGFVVAFMAIGIIALRRRVA